MSKLVNIVLNHRFSILGCARQNVSQRCPSLTKFLPNDNYDDNCGNFDDNYDKND